MKNALTIVTCTAILLLIAGCSTQRAATEAPLATVRGGLVPREALAIARKAALARGAKLESYNTPQPAQLLIRNRRLCWAVVYSPKEKPGEAAPAGGQFTIFVDDQTGRAEFSGGM